MSELTIAAAQYDISLLNDWDDYRDKISFWVERASLADAAICVFPEYGSLEISSLFDSVILQDVDKTFQQMQAYHQQFVELFQSLAGQYKLVIVAPSFPVLEGSAFRNRAYVFSPDKPIAYQDKMVMTRFERRWRNITSATRQNIFQIGPVTFGVAICYDSEFPLLVRRMVDAGAELIVVPSCTDSMAGYNRVRVACRSRALENQCYVVQSPTVGRAHWSTAVDENYGAAAVFAPPDIGFPMSGVINEGIPNNPQWIIATVDLRRIDRVRRHGQVTNHRDWQHQLPENCELTVVDWRSDN